MGAAETEERPVEAARGDGGHSALLSPPPPPASSASPPSSSSPLSAFLQSFKNIGSKHRNRPIRRRAPKLSIERRAISLDPPRGDIDDSVHVTGASFESEGAADQKSTPVSPAASLDQSLAGSAEGSSAEDVKNNPDSSRRGGKSSSHFLSPSFAQKLWQRRKSRSPMSATSASSSQEREIPQRTSFDQASTASIGADGEAKVLPRHSITTVEAFTCDDPYKRKEMRINHPQQQRDTGIKPTERRNRLFLRQDSFDVTTARATSEENPHGASKVPVNGGSRKSEFTGVVLQGEDEKDDQLNYEKSHTRHDDLSLYKPTHSSNSTSSYAQTPNQCCDINNGQIDDHKNSIISPISAPHLDENPTRAILFSTAGLVDDASSPQTPSPTNSMKLQQQHKQQHDSPSINPLSSTPPLAITRADASLTHYQVTSPNQQHLQLPVPTNHPSSHKQQQQQQQQSKLQNQQIITPTQRKLVSQTSLGERIVIPELMSQKKRDGARKASSSIDISNFPATSTSTSSCETCPQKNEQTNHKSHHKQSITWAMSPSNQREVASSTPSPSSGCKVQQSHSERPPTRDLRSASPCSSKLDIDQKTSCLPQPSLVSPISASSAASVAGGGSSFPTSPPPPQLSSSPNVVVVPPLHPAHHPIVPRSYDKNDKNDAVVKFHLLTDDLVSSHDQYSQSSSSPSLTFDDATHNHPRHPPPVHTHQRDSHSHHYHRNLAPTTTTTHQTTITGNPCLSHGGRRGRFTRVVSADADGGCYSMEFPIAAANSADGDASHGLTESPQASWSASSSPRPNRSRRRQLPALGGVAGGGGNRDLAVSPLISGPQSESAESVPTQMAIRRQLQQQQQQHRRVQFPPYPRSLTLSGSDESGKLQRQTDGLTTTQTDHHRCDDERSKNDDEAERRFLAPGYQAAAPTSRALRMTNVKAKSFEETSC